MTAALKRDLNRPEYEAYVGEIVMVLNDIIFVINNLPKWAKDEKAADIDLSFSLVNPTIRKDPLGCVLVIGLVLCLLLESITLANSPRLERSIFRSPLHLAQLLVPLPPETPL